MRPGEASPRPPPWGSSVDAPAQREPAGWGGSLPGTGLPGRTPHGLCAGPGCREPEPQAVWTAVGLLTRPPAWGRWWESVPAGGAGSTWAADARELPGFPSLCGALLSQGAKCLPQRRPWVSARGRVLFCSDARAICVPPASGCLLGLFLLAEGAMGSQQRVRCDRLAAAFVGLLVPVEGEHPHPPDSRRPARAEVLGAPAAAAGQGHKPERQLWGDAERDGSLSLDGAARPGRQPPSFTPMPVQTGPAFRNSAPLEEKQRNREQRVRTVHAGAGAAGSDPGS